MDGKRFKPLFLKVTPKLTCHYLTELERDYLKGCTTYKHGSRFICVDTGEEADRKALDAGERLRSGSFDREDANIIYDWKNGSSPYFESQLAPQFYRNSDAQVKEALARAEMATKAKNDRNAIQTLSDGRLSGVNVRTASAILTCIYPKIYTVIDKIAVRSFDIYDANDFTVDLYCCYLNECRKWAGLYGMELRSLDRALWQWGNYHPHRPI